jgi:hypothetical protein
VPARFLKQFDLQVYFKNLPTEMLCGEVRAINVLLENVGKLPIYKVFFASSENDLFAVASCRSGGNVFALPCGVIEPGGAREVTVFIRACDTSGRISVDLLFYYDSEKSSQPRNLKYRLVYHTMHVLIHESLFSSVTAVRSQVIADESDDEGVNFKVHVENRNQVSLKRWNAKMKRFARILRDFCSQYRCTIRIKRQ